MHLVHQLSVLNKQATFIGGCLKQQHSNPNAARPSKHRFAGEGSSEKITREAGRDRETHAWRYTHVPMGSQTIEQRDDKNSRG